MRKLKLMFSKREWAKRANPCAPWWLLKSTESSHACDEGYFYLLFPWRARSTFPWTRHISPPNIWQQLTNYRMRGLSCWHVITRTQLSSFLFPCKLVEQGWSLLNMRQTEKYGKSSGQDLPELSYSFFSTSKGENTPLAVCVNYLMSL